MPPVVHDERSKSSSRRRGCTPFFCFFAFLVLFLRTPPMHDADAVWAPPHGERIVLVLLLLPIRRYLFANSSTILQVANYRKTTEA
jgi:hypothetical protein